MPPGAKKRRAARRKQQQKQQHASDSPDSQPSSPHPQGNGGALHDLNGSTDASDDDRDSPRAPAPMNGDGGDADDVGVEFVGAADLSPPPEAAAVPTAPAVSEVRVSEPEDVRVSELAEVRVSEPAEEARVSGVSEVKASEPAEEARVSGVSEARVSEPGEESRVSELARVPEPAGEAEIPAAAAVEVSVEPVVYVDVVSEEVVQAVEDKAVLSEDVVDALVVSAVEKARDVDVVGGEFPRVEEGRGVEGREAAITEEAAPAPTPAPAPLIRRRAAWWNCCGLVEVVRGAEA